MITVEHIKKCYADLQKQGVWDDDESQFRKNFLKWSLKNHPDKNPGNENIVQLYQAITGCRNDFLENFNQYKNISKGLYDVQQPQPTFGAKFNEFFKKYAQPTPKPKPAPKAKKAKSAPKAKKSKTKKSKAKKSKAKKSKAKKSKAKKSKTKKSKAKNSKAKNSKAKKSKSKAKKAKSAPKAKKSKSKAKKAKSAPKRKSVKKAKSKAKKAKSAPKRKSVKKSKSKTKKAKSAPKRKSVKKSKSKTKKAKPVPKRKSVKKAKSKSKKAKKTKAKKQKGGKPITSPSEFLRKKQKRVNKPSPLRNEIKPDEEVKVPQIKRIRLVQKKSNLTKPYDAPEWEF
jgi:hypothetical protein